MGTEAPPVEALPVEAPLFSVIVPVFNPDPGHFRQCVTSVIDQTFGHWELLLVADGPQDEPTEAALNRLAGADPRIRVERLAVNGGISAASQVGLEAATGRFVALLDHDDTYDPGALGAFAAELAEHPDVDLAYSDEDRLDAVDGHRKDGFYKPAFSMERLRTQNYLCHLMVVRRPVALEVGGFRSDYDGAQDHDLALRVAEVARSVLHIPRLLYHWRESAGSTALTAESKPWAYEAGTRAVADHLRRTGFPATAEPHPIWSGVTALRPALTRHPPVSVIIPTGGARRMIHGVDTLLVAQAITSLIEHTAYPDLEVVVVLDADSDDRLAATVDAVLDGHRGIVVRNDRPFNFSEACNLGAVRAAGEVLVFLNDDTEITQPEWLERLVMYATRPTIGAVGAKLLYGDGRVQHAGVWSRPTPGHRYHGFAGDFPGRNAALHLAQNCLMVTAACLAVERTKFEEVGAFSPLFPLSFNDVDLCLKLYHAGYRTVIDCDTTVVHHESQSRDPTVEPWELNRLMERWKPILDRDPFDNPCHRAPGADEWPPTPVELVDRESQRGLIDTAGRVIRQPLNAGC